jgi:hypothetical protein
MNIIGETAAAPNQPLYTKERLDHPELLPERHFHGSIDQYLLQATD